MVEIYFNVQSDNGTLSASELGSPLETERKGLTGSRDHALQVWSQNYMQSMQPYKDPRAPLRLQNWMTQAGFVEVESRFVRLPLCGWSNGKPRATNE